MLLQISNFIASDLRSATPILIAAIGLMYSERAGVVNIGAEGIMLFGALAGVLGSWYFGNAWLGVLAAMTIGALSALLFAVLVVTIQADQVVVGAGFNILGLGLTSTLNRIVFGKTATPPKIDSFSAINIPEFITNIPVIGQPLGVLLAQSTPVYLILIIVPISFFILFKTELGLKIRAVGEYPKACDTVGINVYRIRYGTIIVSGVFCGLAGAFVSLGLLSMFMENMIAGRGFMALAAVIFGKYSPWGILIATLIFGAGNALEIRIQAMGTGIPYQFLLMVPYILTILGLVGFVGKSHGPAASGVPYEKE